MSEPISEVVKRYAEDQYRYGRSDKGRIRDQVALAEFCCRVVPDLLAACEAARQFSQACDREAPPPFNKTPLAMTEAALAHASELGATT